MKKTEVTNPFADKSIGIIPDGGRRWSKENGLSLNSSYNLSMNRLSQIKTALFSKDVANVVYYLFSKQNNARDELEKQAVMLEIEEFLVREKNLARKNDTSLLIVGSGVFGEYEYIPKDPKNCLVALIDYCALDEICNSHVELKDFTFDITRLAIDFEIDAVVRTAGGNTPLSGFLPLQCRYASVDILETLFNDTPIIKIMSFLESSLSQRKLKGK